MYHQFFSLIYLLILFKMSRRQFSIFAVGLTTLLPRNTDAATASIPTATDTPAIARTSATTTKPSSSEIQKNAFITHRRTRGGMPAGSMLTRRRDKKSSHKSTREENSDFLWCHAGSDLRTLKKFVPAAVFRGNATGEKMEEMIVPEEVMMSSDIKSTEENSDLLARLLDSVLVHPVHDDRIGEIDAMTERQLRTPSPKEADEIMDQLFKRNYQADELIGRSSPSLTSTDNDSTMGTSTFVSSLNFEPPTSAPSSALSSPASASSSRVVRDFGYFEKLEKQDSNLISDSNCNSTVSTFRLTPAQVLKSNLGVAVVPSELNFRAEESKSIEKVLKMTPVIEREGSEDTGSEEQEGSSCRGSAQTSEESEVVDKCDAVEQPLPFEFGYE